MFPSTSSSSDVSSRSRSLGKGVEFEEKQDEKGLLLTETNSLLEAMEFGTKTFTNFQDLEKSASSMFVAIYERMFGSRLKNIVRVPSKPEDYAKNCQNVIDALESSVFNVDMSHVNGKNISSGDIKSIRYLVQVFMEILESLSEDQSSFDSKKLVRMASDSDPDRRVQDMSKRKSVIEEEEEINTSKIKVTKPSLDFGSVSSVSIALDNTSSIGDVDNGQTTKDISSTAALKYKLALKEHLQDLRQRELQSRKRMEREMNGKKYKEHLDKIRSIRLHHDLRMQRISLGMQEKAQEEKNLRTVMNFMLHSEKERLREEQRDTDLMLQKVATTHAQREEALENFYKDQIEMVKEQAKEEAYERKIMEHAHKMASDQLLRELKQEREHQVEQALLRRQQIMKATLLKKEQKLETGPKKSTGKKKKSNWILRQAALNARTKKKERQRELHLSYGA